jgi:poly-gamma-glutamate synthesis protein (capsule biosynthesis protein)
MSGPAAVTLILCGDVMIGRGIDQVLAHSCPPRLYEPYVDSALEYVALAEAANGPIPRGVGPAYVWGDTLAELERRRPDARIANLETALTLSEDALPKSINYRAHPANVAVLSAARFDCCVLANNHVLDWGEDGLCETLAALSGAGIAPAGAGRDRAAAEAPAVLDVGAGRRVLVFAAAAADSGVPPEWAAGDEMPGVALLPDLSERTADALAARVQAARRPGDVVVASLHWGGNWGYDVTRDHRRFAYALIDRGAADVVHGHSSHHPKAIEVHRGRPILYGCGDFLTDYEGIRGYEAYRGNLVLMYFPTLDAQSGALLGLEMVPLVLRRFQLHRASASEREWLRTTLGRECRRFGGRVVAHDDAFVLEWE